MTKDNYALVKKYAQSPEIIQRFIEITGTESRAMRYINSVIIAVSANDSLKQCTPQSIMKAAADAANLSLDVDPRIGEAYLVPYGDTATLIPGWRGLRNMAYHTGKVLYLNTNALYEGQEWVENQLTGIAHIEGTPTSRNAIGYFAYLETKDHRIHTEYMTVEEIHQHKEKYAKGYTRNKSAWKTEFEKMAKKTVLRQLLYLWAEFDTSAMEYLDGLDDTNELSIGDDFPDPSQVTYIEKPKHTNQEILNELYPGEDNKSDDSNIADIDSTEKPSKPEVKTTNYPGSQGEYYAWVTQGEIPYIGIKDAKEILQKSNGELDIAWEAMLSLSKDRVENKGKAKKNQPNLI